MKNQIDILIHREDFVRCAEEKWWNRGQASDGKPKNQALEQIKPHPRDMRVINVTHKVGKSTNVPKAEFMDNLREMDKIRKMDEGDMSHQPLARKQIMAMHNLEQTIKFGPQNFTKIQMPHEDPLVITLKITNYLVRKALMDGGSVVEIMFKGIFQKIGLLDEEIISITTPLLGFNGASMVPIGTIRLDMIVGEKVLIVKFVVINTITPCNVIMERVWIQLMKGSPSILHHVI